MLRGMIVTTMAALVAGCGSSGEVRDAGATGGTRATPPVALALRADGPFRVGTSVQLHAVGLHADGSEEPLSGADVSFTSSDERVASVDAQGLVTLVAGGPVRLTARAFGLEAVREARATCTYPEHRGVLAHGEVVPPLSWPTRRPDGTAFELRLEDVYCDADWAHVETLALLFYAGWCPYCTAMAGELEEEFPALEALGMQLVFVLVEDRAGDPAHLAFAWEHMQRITDRVPGIVIADADTRPVAGAVAASGILRGFPTNVVVRTSDMRIVTGRRYAGSGIPLADIAAAPDADWGVFHDRCGGADPGEWTDGVGNDEPEQATPAGIGVVTGGICRENDRDHYAVDIEGPWRAELRWDPATTDPLELRGLAPVDEPAAVRLDPPADGPQTRSLAMTGPAVLLVLGRHGTGSGPYTLEITAR